MFYVLFINEASPKILREASSYGAKLFLLRHLRCALLCWSTLLRCALLRL
jgi:hypothetical protein